MDPLTLPRAAWRERAGLGELCAALGAGSGDARFVGGAVRDTLLGLAVADIDIATTHSPQRVLSLLKTNGIKAVPTGFAHGTITALTAGGPVEVTTLRHDVATDGRHATVAFTDDWREDAARRDFTINALYADPASGEVFDYFGGIGDLDARRVRFIGYPLSRIAEDHLRILRFFRFHARFGDTIDPAGLAACAARANDLMALSRERIASELLKLLVAPHVVETLTLMVEHGILAPVLPEIDRHGAERLDHLARREAEAAIAPEAIRRLAALLPPEPAIADDVGARLKLSNADRRRLAAAAADAGAEPALVIGHRIGAASAIDRLLLSARPIGDAAALVGAELPALPIGGGALVARGIGKGPDVARLLRAIEERWIEENFPGAARVDQIADELVAQALRSIRNA